MKKLITAVTIALSSVAAQAEFVDGNKLLSWLESSNEAENALGVGYVAGVFDGLSGSVICAPSNVTLRQVSDMTVRGLKAVPEARDKSADQFVSAIASSKWPCKKKTGTSNV